MNRKRLPKHLVFLMFFIFLVNFFANKFYWYFSIWWFDMPMHFLGGFWIGLAFVFLFPPKYISLRTVLKIVFFVLLIGVGWELFEIFFNNYIAQNTFNTLDTISDIFFDLAGGGIAILYFLKRIMPIVHKSKNGVQLD